MDAAKQLYLSNDPCSFAACGILFEGELPASPATSRVRFAHANGSSERLRLVATLASAGKSAHTITLIGASAGPGSDVAKLERAVEERFGSAHAAPAATRHVIAAGHAYVLCDLVLDPGQVVAGCYDVHSVGESGLQFRVIACDPSHHQLGVHVHLPELESDGSGKRGVFTLS